MVVIMVRAGRIVAGIVAVVAGVGVVRGGRIFQRRLWRRIRWGGIEIVVVVYKSGVVGEERGVVSYAFFLWMWKGLVPFTLSRVAIRRGNGEWRTWVSVDMGREIQSEKFYLELFWGIFFLSFFFLCLGFFFLSEPLLWALAFRVGAALSLRFVFLYRYHAATVATVSFFVHGVLMLLGWRGL